MKKNIALLAVGLLSTVVAAGGSTFNVTTTADSGSGSLRWAITNANATPGTNNIYFNISSNVVETIAPQTPLPVITQPVVIDGYTEPGSYPNSLTNSTGNTMFVTNDNARILIEITGANLTNDITTNLLMTKNLFLNRNCFVTVTNNCVFRGMNLHSFYFATTNYNQLASAIVLSNATGCVVEGNFIGTVPAGNFGSPNNCGVFVLGGGTNRIGGTNAAARNLIACNWRDVRVNRSTTNVIAGNFFGIPAVAPAAFLHTPYDISALLENGCSNNLVGGADFGSRNYFVGAPVSAIEVDESSSTSIFGNWIGLNPPTNNFAGGNNTGIRFSNAWNNAVGGFSTSFGNVISGNTSGIWISGPRSFGNTIYGNLIGTGPDGTNAFANDGTGVIIDSGAVSNRVGGASVSARNLISGNSAQGVLISSNGTSFNIVSNNFIGVDITGTNALANNDGVTLSGGASGNFIFGNLISANTADGIVLDGSQTTNNTVQGNSIGPDSTGLKAPVTFMFFNYSPAYQGRGVLLQNGAAWNQTGGYAAGQGNTIAFNAGDGVLVYDTATHDAVIGNSIHDNFGLGINLQPSGEFNSAVTPNHPGGGTSGPNELLNFPILTNTIYTPTTTVISGAITNGQPNQNFSVEFYANTTNDPSGNGQGKIYLGHTSITTDVSGNANFNFAAAGYLAQNYLAATATSLSGSGSLAGSTSEFGPDLFALVPSIVITNAAQAGTNFTFSFQTYSGQSYTIQTNGDLTTTNWNFFLNTTGDGSIQKIFTPDRSRPQLFFRVREP